jgi:hypothetical protein
MAKQLCYGELVRLIIKISWVQKTFKTYILCQIERKQLKTNKTKKANDLCKKLKMCNLCMYMWNERFFLLYFSFFLFTILLHDAVLHGNPLSLHLFWYLCAWKETVINKSRQSIGAELRGQVTVFFLSFIFPFYLFFFFLSILFVCFSF